MPILTDREPGACTLIAEGSHDPHGAHLVVDVALLDKQIKAVATAMNTATKEQIESLDCVVALLSAIYGHLTYEEG